MLPIYFPIDSYAPNYEVRLVHPSGYYVDEIDEYVALDYTLVMNDVGSLTITLPAGYPRTYLTPDARLEVWRGTGQRLMRLEGDTQWFITQVLREVDESGNKSLKVTAESANTILKRRIVAYNADSGYDYGAAAADDLMKTIVKQNFGISALDSTRNITDLTIDGNASVGPTVYAQYPWKNVLDTLKEISNASYQLGTAIYFDVVVLTPPSGLGFRTFGTTRGADRRQSGTNALVVGYDYGTVGAYSVLEDYSDEATYIYAGGAGEDDIRQIVQLQDATRGGRGPFSRKELFVDASQADTTSLLTGAAQAALIANRPKKLFTGKLLSTPGALYGVHWNWGDYVTAAADGDFFDCRVVGVHVSVQNTGESIDAVLRSDT